MYIKTYETLGNEGYIAEIELFKTRETLDRIRTGKNKRRSNKNIYMYVSNKKVGMENNRNVRQISDKQGQFSTYAMFRVKISQKC